MTRFRKGDVDFHSDGYRDAHAAVNVKQRHWVDEQTVMDRFGCSKETALQAIEYATESNREQFWEGAAEDAVYFFGQGYGVFSEGRSGGWATVHYNRRSVFDRDDVDGWDAIELSKWARFSKSLESMRDWYSSDESILEMIEMNDWAHDQTAMEGVIADALA